jgi:Polysaccharide deacetylase
MGGADHFCGQVGACVRRGLALTKDQFKGGPLMSIFPRSLSAAVALGLAVAAGVAAPAALAAPAGPPALMPNGRVASPPSVVSPQISMGCPAAPSGVYSAAPGSGKTVALTFDDGPGASTGQILSILSSAGVTATFFNIG